MSLWSTSCPWHIWLRVLASGRFFSLPSGMARPESKISYMNWEENNTKTGREKRKKENRTVFVAFHTSHHKLFTWCNGPCIYHTVREKPRCLPFLWLILCSCSVSVRRLTLCGVWVLNITTAVWEILHWLEYALLELCFRNGRFNLFVVQEAELDEYE